MTSPTFLSFSQSSSRNWVLVFGCCPGTLNVVQRQVICIQCNLEISFIFLFWDMNGTKGLGNGTSTRYNSKLLHFLCSSWLMCLGKAAGDVPNAQAPAPAWETCKAPALHFSLTQPQLSNCYSCFQNQQSEALPLLALTLSLSLSFSLYNSPFKVSIASLFFLEKNPSQNLPAMNYLLS